MKPRFTDTHKFSAPYVTSGKTDVSKTFARVRREQAEQERMEKEAMRNVKQIKRKMP